MSTNDPRKRILTEFGEPEEFFGFTFDDLKLLIPSLFLGMIVVGNMPATFDVIGWGIAGGLVFCVLVLVYASPGHLSTQGWLTARLHHLRRPSIFVLSPDDVTGDDDELDELTPEIEELGQRESREDADGVTSSLQSRSASTRTQELTNIEEFHIAHRAGERADGYVFGAVRVHPANMALVTQGDWEQTVERFGRLVNGIEFPFQIYSTVTPVDPERITSGYRDRLAKRSSDLDSEFRMLLQTYREILPRDFARRGTSVREFYAIVPVSTLDVQRDVTPVNEGGILSNLENLSYVGGFITALRASRRDLSPEELEAKQLAELEHRLTTIEEEIGGLDGCRTTRISTTELAALLKDFWEPGSRTDEDPIPTPRSSPVVSRESALDAPSDPSSSVDDSVAPSDTDTSDSTHPETPNPDDGSDSTSEYATQQSLPPDAGLSELHRTMVAAPSVSLTSAAAQVGEQWVKTLLVVNYPDVAATRMLDSALTRLPDIDLDYSIHVKPRDPTRTIGKLRKSIRDLKVKQAEKAGRGDVTQIDTEQALEDHQAIYSQLISGSQRIFDVSIYLTVRGPEKEAVEQAAERLTRTLQASQLTAKSATYRQDDALVCTSPVGKDVLDQSATMLGGAVGCLYPFTSGTIIEETGVLMGYHSVTGSPVVVDRFAREKGYNCLVAGNTGAGKTFNTVLGLLRAYAKDEDTMVIVADPFGDLGMLTNILDGERVVVSGKRGLNPLEITRTPASVLEANPDLDPYTKTVQKDVMEFIQAFFAMEDMSLTGKRGVLSVAVKEAYRRNGITPDPATHDNESPTLRDVQDVLTDIAQNPTGYIDAEPDTVPDIEEELWRKRASQLRMNLAPFREGGEYANLADKTEIDIGSSDVLYLDLQQIEGKQKTGLMLQLVLRAVYERVKQTEQKVIFAIDEAHYLMQNEASLSFLERATRHARHYDLSLQLITQTVDEFFSRSDSDEFAQKTKAIADNCVLKIFHQVEGLTDANAEEWLDLSPPEAEFIRNAKPGSEEYGYSQALIEVGEAGRFPVNVHALPEEERLITVGTGREYGLSSRDRETRGPDREASDIATREEDEAGVDERSTAVTNGSGDSEDDEIESGGQQEKHSRPQVEPSGGQRAASINELEQSDIAELLTRADPLELRRALSSEEIENLGEQIDDSSNE